MFLETQYASNEGQCCELKAEPGGISQQPLQTIGLPTITFHRIRVENSWEGKSKQWLRRFPTYCQFSLDIKEENSISESNCDGMALQKQWISVHFIFDPFFQHSFAKHASYLRREKDVNLIDTSREGTSDKVLLNAWIRLHRSRSFGRNLSTECLLIENKSASLW